MASTAAPARARTLSQIFSSTTPRPRPPKPAASPKAPASKVEPKPSHKDRVSLNRILQGVFRERDPDKLVSKFVAASGDLPRFRDRHRVYEVAVSRLATFGRQDAVTAIIDAQKPFLETSSEGFAARLVRLYGRASMPSKAAATFHSLPTKHRSVLAFNSLLAAYVDSGDFDALATTFQEIPAKYPTVVPNVSSYNILIHALCQKPDLSAALDVIALMEKCGIPPDTISFNTLLNGFYNNGRMDDVDKVWDMMKVRNIEPDTKSYNAKLRGLVAEGMTDDAASLIERMEKDGPKPDTVTYNELIRGYCKDGKLDEAIKVYDNLVKNECVPNKGTFETLMPHVLEAGEFDLVVKLCHEIFSRKSRVDCPVLQDAVNALVAASRVEEAIKIVELGRKNYYPRRRLKMPVTGKDKAVEGESETDAEDSMLDEEGSEDEEKPGNT